MSYMYQQEKGYVWSGKFPENAHTHAEKKMHTAQSLDIKIAHYYPKNGSKIPPKCRFLS